ncbi:MAG TPA: hypothetical protein VEM96_21140 [Pyrinomonadaceae bacterium]|nr:hypothetical protein [Pyrinomonadaceae bacterium]
MEIKLLRTIVLAMIAGLALVGGVSAQEMSAHHHPGTGNSDNANPETIQDWAKERLAKVAAASRVGDRQKWESRSQCLCRLSPGQ